MVDRMTEPQALQTAAWLASRIGVIIAALDYASCRHVKSVAHSRRRLDSSKTS